MMSRCVLWWVLCLVTVSAGAAELRLAGGEIRVPLAALVEAYEDKSAAMEIDDVVREGAFAPQSRLLHPGATRSAIWLKIAIVNASASPLVRWITLQPRRFRHTTMFVRQGGRWQRMDAGGDRPVAQHPVPATIAVFPLELAAGEFVTAYIRIATPGPIDIIPTLWTPLAFMEVENQTRLIHGSMLGGLFVTALFGFLMLFLLKDRAFAFNALATLTYCLGEATAKGYSFIYLWPNATDWAARCQPLFALVGVGLNILFLRALLGTRTNFPRIDRVLLALLTVQWLPIFGILFGDFPRWAEFSLSVRFPATMTLAGVGVYAMGKGVHAARYYTAAYAILAGGSLWHALPKLGVSAPDTLTSYVLPIGMLVSNLLMLASVLDRIIVARREKEAAQEALLAARAAHEAQLERAVEARTADLHDALAETRAANRAKSNLVAFIGHDLRAPLATIINYVHLLGRHQEADADRYRSTIERSAQHQLELIDDLVEYARGELQHLELLPAPTYVHDWLHDIAGQAELLAGQRGNRFALQADPRIPPVVVFDPKRLKQVLVNLLANAAKFTTGGEIRLTLAVAVATARDLELVIGVENTGEGIPQEDVERIFQPFEQREPEREGFGLGLAIARQLVSAMGGELGVESRSGKGSRFGFRLRLEIGREADVPYPTQAFVFPGPFGAGKALLVVDDNAASRDYLREVLSTADFEIVCSEDGRQALELALARRFDAILVDQTMPGLDGWAFLRKLHDARPGAAPPVVMVSAMPPQRPPGYPQGIDVALALLKPVAADTLLQTLEALLSGAPAPAMQMPPAAMLAPLQQFVADGSVSDIEEWALATKTSHPEFSEFADRIQRAARHIDFAELGALCHGGQPA